MIRIGNFKPSSRICLASAALCTASHSASRAANGATWNADHVLARVLSTVPAPVISPAQAHHGGDGA